MADMIADNATTSPNGPLEQVVVLQRPMPPIRLTEGVWEAIGMIYLSKEPAAIRWKCSRLVYGAGRPSAAVPDNTLEAHWTNPPSTPLH